MSKEKHRELCWNEINNRGEDNDFLTSGDDDETTLLQASAVDELKEMDEALEASKNEW